MPEDKIPEPMTDKELASIEARYQLVSRLPWTKDFLTTAEATYSRMRLVDDDVPALLAEVRRLQEDMKELGIATEIAISSGIY